MTNDPSYISILNCLYYHIHLNKFSEDTTTEMQGFLMICDDCCWWRKLHTEFILYHIMIMSNTTKTIAIIWNKWHCWKAFQYFISAWFNCVNVSCEQDMKWIEFDKIYKNYEWLELPQRIKFDKLCEKVRMRILDRKYQKQCSPE